MTALTMIAIGAGLALVLAVSIEAAHWRPRPKRSGFAVRYERRPTGRNS